jgi:phage/conjugal plasmid C-4 type zinc finger TraR family protein
MMNELDFIAAELLVELDVAARVAQVQGALMGKGSDQCEDCGAVIEAARRRAAPFAVRCVHCQADAERQKGVM